MLTFSNGVKLYMTGGTSTTKQMAEMANMEIDYAFYRCDGVYNMGLKEAARCAEPVEAKHNIPYHKRAGENLLFPLTTDDGVYYNAICPLHKAANAVT